MAIDENGAARIVGVGRSIPAATDIGGRMGDNEERSPADAAAHMAALLPELIAQRDAAKSARERKPLSARIRSARIVIAWAKSRAG